MIHQLKSQPVGVLISRVLYMADVTRYQDMRATNHTSREKEFASETSTNGHREQHFMHPLLLQNPIKQLSRAAMGVKRTAASVKRKKCTFEDDLIYSHRQLPLDSSGTSPYQFYICFSREGTTPVKAAAGSTGGVGASAVLPKKKRAVSRRHLKLDDFSRDRIEELYKKSHRSSGIRTKSQWAREGARARLTSHCLQKKGLQGILLAAIL
jgi:hypothetical protein